MQPIGRTKQFFDIVKQTMISITTLENEDSGMLSKYQAIIERFGNYFIFYFSSTIVIDPFVPCNQDPTLTRSNK